MTNPIRLWTREHFHKLVVMHDSVFGRRMVVSDPAIIRHVLAGDPANFPRDALQQRIIARVTGNSVFSAMGESWKLQRSLLGGQFVPTRIKAYEAAFEQIASAACQRLAAARGEAIDLFAFMGAVAVSAINQALLSGRLREPPEQVERSIQAFAATQGKLRLGDLLSLPALPLDSLRREVRCVHARAHSILATQKVPREERDAVDILHSAEGLSERQRRDNISTLLGAGADTTGTAMAWAVLLAARDEGASDMLRGTDGIAASAVVREVLRLFPPAPVFSRVAMKTCAIGNLTIRGGTTIIIAPWLVHRHRQLWQDPDDFRAGRFLTEATTRAARYSFLPFGGGPRICIGQGFAMLEMETGLRKLFRTFHFELLTPLPVSLRQVITLRPSKPVFVRAIER
ncbi:MAG: cytochrome P450 [Phyllobacteriaceae bacterium]|nr:cytochrome P450 [Phyllobacteriaceae bacterium]